MMKKFAYYLPQFHEIPENNKWWGKGFTEWTNVKRAKPLFKGHVQPVHPMDDNYYDLTNPETLQWQAKIANSYGIDGMIFYHYYFCGKKLLEKPAELLLKRIEIPMGFFFCWANHSWYRSWEGSKELLLEQSYGSRKDWEKHLEYLLPFFRDERYEKKDNKPLLMLFDPDFPEKDEMVEFFDETCKENGFSGIYIIESKQSYSLDQTGSVLHSREPNSSFKTFKYSKLNSCYRIKNYIGKKLHNWLSYKFIEKYNGNKLLKLAAKQNYEGIIPGLCFEWDNTPRHGYRGFVITPPSKETFFSYMDSICDSDYLFIDAWNEWCEGMVLEPTEENGYKYLEWIKEWSEKNENRFNGI